MSKLRLLYQFSQSHLQIPVGAIRVRVGAVRVRVAFPKEIPPLQIIICSPVLKNWYYSISFNTPVLFKCDFLWLSSD